MNTLNWDFVANTFLTIFGTYLCWGPYWAGIMCLSWFGLSVALGLIETFTKK